MYAQGGIRPNARQATGNRRPLKTAKDWAVSFVVAHKTKGRASLPRDEVSYHLEIMKLRKAMLYVKDLERMKRFYSEILGATPTNRDWTDVWATFETGGAQFALHAVPGDIAKNIEITSPPIPREEDPVKLIFEVKDVESERARLESLGTQMLRRPWQKPGETCDAVDPEGNIFQICSASSAFPSHSG